MLNKINKKNFEKSLDLANFVNFADLPQGDRGYHPHPPLLVELCQTPSLARCSRNSRESSREFSGTAHRKFRAKNMTPFLFYH